MRRILFWLARPALTLLLVFWMMVLSVALDLRAYTAALNLVVFMDITVIALAIVCR